MTANDTTPRTIAGYGISVAWDGSILRVHGNTKAARVALAGRDHATDVIVPVGAIAAVQYRPAGTFTNGRITVHTGDGAQYKLHFLRKHQEDMEALARALGADI